jgi:hypothetical protein
MRTLIPAALLLAAGCTAPSLLQSEPTAARVLADMKSACGGAAWDGVKGWHETGTVDLPGRPSVPYEIWHDMRTLKTAMLNRVDGHVIRQAGYNGAAYWQAGPDGKIEIGAEPVKLRRQRRDAYLSSAGWFFPDRFPATIDLVGTQRLGGKVVDVLHISHEDADSFELWVERDTHHVRRIVAGTEYANLSDYRMFGGVCSATTGRQGDGDPTHEIVLHVQTVETDQAIPASTFAPPAER